MFSILKIRALLMCASIGFGLSLRAADVPAWRLVWSDEFNQTDGSAPASANWGYDTGAGGWGNEELENYTSRRTNSWIQGGTLIIQALKENLGTSQYTSARLKTQGKQSWTYGRIEARIKLPRGQGIWPAFWMLGQNFPTVGWPACGEIDIMENIGKEPTTVHGTMHGPGYSGSKGFTGPYSLPGSKIFADDFHVYAVEWETNRIRWLVDNVTFLTATPSSIPAGATWAFDKPQFIILNLAVGGTWPGTPDATTVFPARLTVDYVRVYTRTNAPSASLNIQRSSTNTIASWPAEFPNARLQRSTTIGSSWQDQVVSGAIQNGRFFENISAGVYRLRWQ